VEQFKFFLTSLLETVRINIGYCAASSYKTLSMSSAREILMFNTLEVRSTAVDNYVFILILYALHLITGNSRIFGRLFPRMDY
jgi:hypothetical protein